PAGRQRIVTGAAATARHGFPARSHLACGPTVTRTFRERRGRRTVCRPGCRRVGMTVKIIGNDKGGPPGKLADAELHFTEGPLAGLKLVGFSIWERKGDRRNVTFPARAFSINGERRSFALLRPNGDSTAQGPLRDLILAAYEDHVAAAAVA